MPPICILSAPMNTTRIFRVNLENNLNRVSKLIQIHTHGSYYRHTLKQLVTNLKLLKQSHNQGQSRDFLDKFYAYYEFNKKEELKW